MQPPLPSLSEISPPQSSEWSLIYSKIKINGNYKSIQANIESYTNKITNLFVSDQSEHPSLAFKKTDHRKLLNQVQMNIMKMVDEIAMLNLNDLATSLEYVFQKIRQCLGTLFDTLQDVVAQLVNQTSINHNRYVYTSKCSECQNNLLKAKVENTMHSMTLGHTKKSIEKIGNQIDCLGENKRNQNNDADLTIMIDQVLQKKQSILGSKNSRINTIYEQIGHYLENMPQTSLNMFKNDSILNASSSQNAEFSGYFNFSEEFEKNMGQMLKNPVKKLIGRIMEHSKSIYCKNTEFVEASTQTYLIKDEENIKMLIKSNQNLKKQIQNLRKSRRQVEKDLSKIMEAQQINQIKIKQLTMDNQYIREKLEKTNTQLTTTKQKVEQAQKTAEKNLKDYYSERSQFLRCIRQYEEKIEVTSSELLRLRKQTQGNMISQCFGTQQVKLIEIESLDQKEIQSEFQIRYSNNSKKNIFVKFARKSITNINNQSRKDSVMQNKQIKPFNNNLKKSTLLLESKVENKIKQNAQIVQKNERVEKKVKTMNIKKDIIKHKTENFGNQKIYQRSQKTVVFQKESKSFKTQPKQEQYQDEKSRVNLLVQGKVEKSFPCSNMNLRVLQKDRQNSSINASFKNLIKNDHSNKSSRMFISKQHCSPYIGGNFGNLSLTSFNRENICIDAIEMNRQSKMMSQTQNHNEGGDSQKLSFLSKMMQSYYILRENGNLEKIKKLLNINSLNQKNQNESGQIKGLENEPKKHPKMTLTQRKQERENMIQSRTNQRRINKVSRNLNSKQRIHLMSPICSYTNSKTNLQFEKFTLAEALSLFISMQNAKKYELNTQIWMSLDHSIMVDYHFMSLCDLAEVFFQYLKKNMEAVYREVSQFLQYPVKYLQKRSLLKERKQQSRKNTQKLRQRCQFLSNNLPLNDSNEKAVASISLTKSQTPQVFESKQSKPINCNQLSKNRIASPHELRSIIHKILRFHKIFHKKCNHVQQFLNVIGFDKKSCLEDPLKNIQLQ